MRYRLERLRRRGDTATFSSNASSLRPLPGAAQLVALHRRITDAGALEDGEYLRKQTIRSAGRAAADTDMPSGQGTDAISNGPQFICLCSVQGVSCLTRKKTASVSAPAVSATAAAARSSNPGKTSGREWGSPLADEDKRRRLALPEQPRSRLLA
jgi:hypothetical protein